MTALKTAINATNATDIQEKMKIVANMFLTHRQIGETFHCMYRLGSLVLQSGSWSSDYRATPPICPPPRFPCFIPCCTSLLTTLLWAFNTNISHGNNNLFHLKNIFTFYNLIEIKTLLNYSVLTFQKLNIVVSFMLNLISMSKDIYHFIIIAFHWCWWYKSWKNFIFFCLLHSFFQTCSRYVVARVMISQECNFSSFWLNYKTNNKLDIKSLHVCFPLKTNYFPFFVFQWNKSQCQFCWKFHQ